MPRVLGSMMLRPGLGYIGNTKSNLQAKFLPFIFSSADTAKIELTNTVMRVWVNDAVISRPAVTAAVTNGNFGSDVTGWTDSDESGATSAWLAGGYLSLVGTGYARAIRTQQVTVNETGVEHALRIVIERGPVILRVGSTVGAEDYVAETSLGTGTHSLAFTPTGDFFIHFSSRTQYAVLVDSVNVEASGVMELPTPWLTASLSLIRYAPSGDVIFIACEGYQQRRIERRATRSWSIVLYAPVDGPFRIENVSTIHLTPSAISGDITLTSSVPLFKSTHVGALFSLDSVGQTVSQVLTGDAQWSDPIRVTGVENTRQFRVNITGTWVGTIKLQRSVGDIGAWTDVVTYTANTNSVYDDNLDNQIIYYRIGMDTGGYTSGTATAQIIFSGGSLTGIVEITAYSSSTSVSARVLQHLGNASATDNWSEGAWSAYRGYPSAGGLYEGRLWWGGKDKQYGSISDSYSSFDDTLEGDAGPISRSIGEGPIDVVNWILPLERLLLSTAGGEWSAKSSSFDEPLTPTAFNLKRFSTQGSAKVAPVAVDSEGLYVQKSGIRVHNLVFDAGRYNYDSIDATALVPEIGSPGIVHLAVQRQPDTRVHCVRSDGKVAVFIYDKVEAVKCWVLVETDGVVEDVVVTPGSLEDNVYYVVKRTINGSDVRFLEKWALETECRGGNVNKQADAFVAVDLGAPGTVVSGLTHLEGETVVVWGDGDDRGTYTVTGGAITLDTACRYVVAGLSYEARYQSTKLKELDVAKRIVDINLMLAYTHSQGIQFGGDFDVMDDLPLIEEGTTVPSSVWSAYHNDSTPFPGNPSVDSRVCIKAAAPRPAGVLAIVVNLDA